jgi:hypothetical protein
LLARYLKHGVAGGRGGEGVLAHQGQAHRGREPPQGRGEPFPPVQLQNIRVFFLALQIFSSFSSRVLEVKQKSELKFVLANLCFAVLWIRNDFFQIRIRIRLFILFRILFRILHECGKLALYSRNYDEMLAFVECRLSLIQLQAFLENSIFFI